MKLIFVRHGQSEANAMHVLAGQEIDSPLTEMGREQARATRDKLPEKIDRIICSPMKRAAETAIIINERYEVPLEYDDQVKEVSNGSLSSHTWEEAAQIARDPLFEKHDTECTYDYTPFGGESAQHAKARVKTFVESLLRAHRDETILVSAHGGIINAMHALYPTEKHWDIDNGTIHEFEIK